MPWKDPFFKDLLNFVNCWMAAATEEEKLQKLLAGEEIFQQPSQKEESSIEPPPKTLSLEPIDTSAFTSDQQALEDELCLFPNDESLWYQLIQSCLKVMSTHKQQNSNVGPRNDKEIIQDRVWKDKYLRNIYRRMLTGPFKYMAWLWVEYLLFEASLIGFQLPSATLLPFIRKLPGQHVSPWSESAASFLEEAFQYALQVCYSPNVWMVYINFLKKKLSLCSPTNGEPGSQEKQIWIQTYESALSKVGLDIYSGLIWVDYINFLKSEKVSLYVLFYLIY